MLKDLSIKHLGRLVDLSIQASHYNQAQLCLIEMQTRLENAKAIEPNELLAELPFVETKEPVLNASKESMLDERKRRDVALEQVAEERIDAVGKKRGETHAERTAAVQATDGHKQMLNPPIVAVINNAAPEAGPPRDKNGKITRISVKEDDPGYDPEVYKNKALKIYCDGKHIVPAHTADTVLGLVRYHEKNEQGRIKTLELHGKVEIRGLE